MSFDLLEYYKALNGESTETSGIWHINYDKRHAYKISSAVDIIDGSNRCVNLTPSEAKTECINLFSDKLGQKLKNTKITDNGDGTESIDLELDDRIVTIIMDQSGSMTWNDHNNFRHDVVTDLINKIEINYPGNITYNLIEYGSDIINVLFFGIVENDAFDPNDIDSLSVMIKADDKANYDGIRVIRNDDHYPTSVLDGELVDDGFISRIKDTGLVEGQIYYYTIYTYDKNFKFSEGVRVKITPQQRIVPRSISNFRTIVDSEDISKGIPFIGAGINRDANTLGIWHMDEGEGKYLYDFSDSNFVIELKKENPTWYESRFVPAGSSGLFFDGENILISKNDPDNIFEFDITNGTSDGLTIMGWIYLYNIDKYQYIISRDDGVNTDYFLQIWNNNQVFFGAPTVEVIPFEAYKWQHFAITYNRSNFACFFYLNGIPYEFSAGGGGGPTGPFTSSSSYKINIGQDKNGQNLFQGKMTEISIHNIARSSDYINAQLVSNPIYNDEGAQVDTEIIGLKKDNGDRLSVFKYNVPRDYNYVGGEVLVVRNEKNIPSWEEDGTVIYQVSDPGPGEFFISDPYDFVLGEKYYYRLFTKNSLNNLSFLTDSPFLEIIIPEASVEDYFVELYSAIDPPESPTIGQLITAGNKKIYLRWKQNDIVDSRIAKTKIFYSSSDYPVVNNKSKSNGQLVFTGLVTDEKFVHRGIPNDENAYYTIVNIDKYGRSSNYNSEGVQVEDFLHATAIPNSDANENIFPLIEIENVNYELVDENTITIGWDQPQKSIEDINAYFDQTVYIYGSITDEFGDAVSVDTPIKMSISSFLDKESQADNVFGSVGTRNFEDIDAYDFFVTRTDDGFFKGILRMTSNSNIISQIKSANFKIQLKVLLPKEGGYTPPNDDTGITDPVSEYSSLIEQLTEEETLSSTDSSDNFYEYYSKKINVFFTNPWEIEIVNRDNQRVSQRCYCIKEDERTGEKRLYSGSESFNGIYIKATNPFIARAKIRYKGQPIESGNIQLAVWDADSSDLCRNACLEESTSSYEGPKLQTSTTVLPPDSYLPVIQGEEDDGSGGTRSISFVDIPLYAPDIPQAVRLFVKGETAGYSSVKDIYVLFQSILQINIDVSSGSDKLVIDGKDIAEFRATAFIINPDYPNYNIAGSIDESLVTYPSDLTIVQWEKTFVQTLEGASQSDSRPLYSTDSVPLTNGVYSYTRNGTARNVFLGPVPKGSEKIYEEHEIKASIVYQGLSAFVKTFFTIGPYDPDSFDRTSARFLMEIDGGWGKNLLPNQVYGGGGWKQVKEYPLWADGIHYKKIKISRNPRTAVSGTDVDEFAYADCFRYCASSDDNELLELSSGQVVEVGFGLNSSSLPSGSLESLEKPVDEEIEILHGEIYEREDVYTGLHYLEVGEEGFIDNGKAFIELNSEDISDVTYFYIRINKFVPYAKPIDNRDTCDWPVTKTINDCKCLDGSDPDGITECDLPKWSPVLYVDGKTTVFLNNNPLVLTGGGTMETGIPPCPIGLNEPLSMLTVEKKVTNYYYSEDFGNPSNDFLYPIEIIVDNNNFCDDNNETLVKYTSDVDIRIKVFWRGQNVPNNTPIYVITGDNTSSSLFVASKNVYYTDIGSDGDSYVDVKINARKYIEETRTEQIEIYSIYDENGKTDRHVGQTFSITLDKKDKEIETPELPSVNPSTGEIIKSVVITPYSATVYKYDITTDIWSQVANMQEAKGNAFSGSVGNYIYYMGGLLNNNLNISNLNERYDITHDQWSNVETMPTGRFGGMSITIGGDIYTIGGIYSNIQAGGNLSVSTSLEVYHTNDDMWEELAHLPIIYEGTAFEESLGVAFGTASHVFMNNRNYIYILGGVKDITATGDQFAIGEYNQRILRYCVENDEWEYSDILRSNELNTYERISPLSIIFDDKVIVFNGAILSGDDFIYPVEDFYIDIKESFETPSSGQWLTFGSGFMGDFPEPKFQSAMAEYNLNPSADHADYYIFGGTNHNSPSLDIVEKIQAIDNDFKYKSSYTITDPSIDLTSMLVGKHGSNAEYSSVSGSPCIYLMGGYTINKDDDYIDIIFDI